MASTFAHELARKAIHLGSAVIPVAYAAGLPRRVLAAGLVALLALALVVEVARFRSPRARVWFSGLVGAHGRHRAYWYCHWAHGYIQLRHIGLVSSWWKTL